VLVALLLLLLCAVPVDAFEDELLERLTGDWVMRGTIAGQEIVHDLRVEWILAHHYLQISEIARERDADGNPAYEALVLIGRDEATGNYACLWLDITGGGGLTNGVIGVAQRDGDAIPFVFDTGDASAIHNTFSYDRAADRWRWRIDNVRDGDPRRFADVTLRRE
jgi:hypothetical protein